MKKVEEHGNPLADLQGAGTNLTATIIAQAGDVRRFRDAGAFALLRCGSDPLRFGPDLRSASPTSGRQPPAERRPLPDRDRAVPTPPRCPGLPRPQGLRGKDPEGGPAGAEAPPRQRPLPASYAWAEQVPAMQT